MTQRWYVVQVHSTFEQKVATQIKEQAEVKGLSDKFGDILVPVEKVTNVKNGKRVEQESRLFPGYILANMQMTDETWHLVSSNSKVTGFLGAGNRPEPVSETEAKRLITQLEEGVSSPRAAVSFDIGEEIRIVDGPFAGFNASVEEVDVERARLKVTVKVFERDTPVDLQYSQVEKV